LGKQFTGVFPSTGTFAASSALRREGVSSQGPQRSTYHKFGHWKKPRQAMAESDIFGNPDLLEKFPQLPASGAGCTVGQLVSPGGFASRDW
jgi:hypothetical protein